MFRLFSIVATLGALMSAPSFAAQFGTVNATYDGEQKAWFTLTLETNRGTAATATFKENSRWSTIHILAQPQSNTPTTIDVLTLDLTYRTPLQTDQDPLSVEITLMPSGTSGPVWTNKGAPQPATVRFDVLDLVSEPGMATGEFSAQLCFSEKLGAPSNPDNCRFISGSFNTSILPVK